MQTIYCQTADQTKVILSLTESQINTLRELSDSLGEDLPMTVRKSDDGIIGGIIVNFGPDNLGMDFTYHVCNNGIWSGI